MTRFKFILLIFLSGLLFAEGIEQLPPPAVNHLSLKGHLIDSQCANTSLQAAFLWEDPEFNQFLAIMDINNPAAYKKITIPDKFQARCLCWLPDDSGILMAFGSARGDDSFYLYNFGSAKFEPVYKNLKKLYSRIFEISFSPGTSYWAVSYAGEGHPDVMIYQDQDPVLQTDVYPNSITILGWQDHMLLCKTGAFLEYGLSREQRKQHRGFDEKLHYLREKEEYYTIDARTKKAAGIDPPLIQLQNISYNSKYILQPVQHKSSFTINISKSTAKTK